MCRPWSAGFPKKYALSLPAPATRSLQPKNEKRNQSRSGQTGSPPPHVWFRFLGKCSMLTGLPPCSDKWQQAHNIIPTKKRLFPRGEICCSVEERRMFSAKNHLIRMPKERTVFPADTSLPTLKRNKGIWLYKTCSGYTVHGMFFWQ